MGVFGWFLFVLGEVWGAVWPQWSVSLFAFVLIFLVFRNFFRKRKIQNKPFDPKQFGHEIIFSILTLGFGNFIGLAIEFLVDNGYGKIISLEDAPLLQWSTIWMITYQFAIYFVLFDVYFYFLHRFMHTDALYWIHKHHHRSESPGPLTAFSFHPVEGLITGGFVPVMVLLFDLHLVSIIVVNMYGILNSVLVHSGYEVYPKWWYNKDKVSRYYISPMYHDVHHSSYKYNFGAFTNIWDRLFGTMHPTFEEDYQKLQSQIVTRN